MYRHVILSEGNAIAFTTDTLTSPQTLMAIYVHVDTAPVTSEDFTVKLESKDGNDYDVIFYDQDLAGVTDLSVSDMDLPLDAGDALNVTYTNTDQRTIGVRLVLS